ncbi:MAG: hypothetical protein EZS28_016817 [Streblomastix strix]|uniref:Uncharacterized protein n=1 Tax=Streblomastix strix TaxID=222440 RepID=A0A5J4VYE2_9EUKA|nr:MAG: hypothetical protein EZS28_016817 [Streblomastix strix]
MLFIIAALILISFSSEEENSKIYYPDFQFNRYNQLIIYTKNPHDLSELSEKQSQISKFKIRDKTTSNLTENYIQPGLDTSDIPNSATAQPLNQDEIACSNVGRSHKNGLYGLIGFTITALLQLQIKPSIAYLISTGPNEIIYTNYGLSVALTHYNIDYQKDCISENTSDYIQFSLRRNGVTESSCISNSAIPDSSKKCADRSKMSKVLKLYRLGQFRELAFSGVKDLLLRFGAVQIGELIIVGWKLSSDGKQKWIAADRDEDNYSYKGVEIEIDEDVANSGQLLAARATSATKDAIATAPVAAPDSQTASPTHADANAARAAWIHMKERRGSFVRQKKWRRNSKRSKTAGSKAMSSKTMSCKTVSSKTTSCKAVRNRTMQHRLMRKCQIS